MNSGSKGKSKSGLVNVIKSFGYAFEGIIEAGKTERNLKIHLVISVLVLAMGWWLAISAVEWLFCLLVIAGVISLELLNTAIEKVVDLVTKDFHPLAKQAKDISAAAVLIYAIFSVIVGLIIFIPKFVSLLTA